MFDQKNINVSNLLSISRIFLAIPIFFYLAAQKNDLALIVIAIAFITDFLDGYFARYFNQITELGKILDPLADKICTTAGILALYFYQSFPLWLTLLIIGRDVVISIASLYFIGRKKMVLSSNRIGKTTVFVIALYACVYIFRWYTIAMFFHYIVIVLVLISIINYGIVFRNELKRDSV